MHFGCHMCDNTEFKMWLGLQYIEIRLFNKLLHFKDNQGAILKS